MEGIRFTTEDDPDDKDSPESSHTKAKRAENLGTSILKRGEHDRQVPAEKTPPGDKTPTVWERLWSDESKSKPKASKAERSDAHNEQAEEEKPALAEAIKATVSQDAAEVELQPEADETEAPLHELGPAEIRFAEQELISASETPESSPPVVAETADEIVVEVTAVEHFRAQITSGASADEALASTMQKIETDEFMPLESEVSGVAQRSLELTDEAELPIAGQAETIEIPLHPGHTSEDEPETVATAGGPTARGSAGSGTPGGPPPRSPGGTGGPGGIPFGGDFAPAAPSAAPPPPELEYVRVRNRTQEVANLLIGGIIGYFIGRRRGRIRTERRLLPIQHKLERQVTELHSELMRKEQLIRQTAALHYRERLAARGRAETAGHESRRNVGYEANQLHGKKLPPERIGGVVVHAEANNHPNIERTRVEPVDQHVETLSYNDLLELSSKIIIGGSSLREMYEAHLFSEKGLRRLVTEHLRGGNVRRQLERELTQRQIDFERDPRLRDQPPQTDHIGGGGNRSLQTLLERAAGQVAANSGEDVVLNARQAYQQNERQKQARQRQLLDISFVVVIAVLIGLVVALLVTHH